MGLVHKHLLVQAKVNAPPLLNYSSERLRLEIENLIKHIDMEILSGPHIAYCDEPNNEGWSGTTIITTSHIAFHSWNTGEIQLDVFSCKDFNKAIVIQWLAQFEPEEVNYQFIDRQKGFKTLDKNSFDVWEKLDSESVCNVQ